MRSIAVVVGLLVLIVAAGAVSYFVSSESLKPVERAEDTSPREPVPPKSAPPPTDPAPIPCSPGLAERLSELAANRKTQLERLRAYIDAGRFPKNFDYSGERVPYFVDAQETACAVAHLMIQDGRGKDVQAIRLADNHVRVKDVNGGPLLVWVSNSGLTKEECARIQPSYEFMDREPVVEPILTAEMEVIRVRVHIEDALKHIRKDTWNSLEVSLRRTLPDVRGQCGFGGAGFALYRPGTNTQVAATNDGHGDIWVRFLSLDAKSFAPITDAGWKRIERSDKTTHMIADAGNAFFVEWRTRMASDEGTLQLTYQ